MYAFVISDGNSSLLPSGRASLRAFSIVIRFVVSFSALMAEMRSRIDANQSFVC